jgi:hypothetical protein
MALSALTQINQDRAPRAELSIEPGAVIATDFMAGGAVEFLLILGSLAIVVH